MIVRGSAVLVSMLAVVPVLALLAAAGCGVQDSPASHMARWHKLPSPRAVVSVPTHAAAASLPDLAPGVSGAYRVGWRQLTFHEPAASPGGARTLVIELRYPVGAPAGSAAGSAATSSVGSPAGSPVGSPAGSAVGSAGGGPFPLLMFAPGFMQCGAPYGDLLRSWASAGYVVATVDFPRADCRAGAGADEADLVNQPADMSFVIGRLLALSAEQGGPLAGLLNPHEIVAAGQSDGGDTVAALAASSCCADHRLAAVAVLSGAEWPPMPGRYFTGRTPPMMFTQGSADTVNPPWSSMQMYRADRSRARYYLDLFGADHTEPYWGSDPVERLVARETLAFFDHYALGQPDPVPAVDSGSAALASDGRLP